MAKILIFGSGGQVGWELSRSLLPLGEVCSLSHDQCDLTESTNVQKIIRSFRPNIIVNAAAYTNVEQAEREPEIAKQLNSEVPGVLSEEARKQGALFVDYSTDYVFNGRKGSAYSESDTPEPLNVYGQTKLAGLENIQQSGCDFLVFRIGWVYSKRGRNFVNTMLRLAQEKQKIKVVDNQFGTPTSADLVADLTAQVLAKLQQGIGSSGLYNLAPNGETSWYDFANTILSKVSKLTGDKIPELQRVNSADFQTLAQRPSVSGLETQKIESEFSLTMPHWEIPLMHLLEDKYTS